MTAFALTDNLNWDVESRPLFYSSAEGTPVLYHDRVAIVRSDNEVCLGVVSRDYETVQNSVLLSKVEPLVNEGLLTIENIGYLNNGVRVFIQAKVAQEFKVLGEDYSSYVTLVNGHTGKSAVALGTSSVRIICGNTFQMAYKDLGARFRHSEGVNTKVLESTEVLDYVNRSMGVYAQQAEILAGNTCTIGNFHKAVEKIHNKKIAEMRNIDTLNQLFYGGKGNEGRTYYDAFNAITEFGSNKSRQTKEGRFNYVNFGTGAKINSRAMEVLSEFATV
jgi:phage/plasmid-like protein (TIGR03299 family)